MVILRNKEDWRVYPEELARMSRDSVRVVRTCLEELERVGYVRTYRKSLGRGKGIQYYRFCSDKKISEQAFKKMISDFTT
ncbi:transcriptional regulator [Streptococcus pyogenes]